MWIFCFCIFILWLGPQPAETYKILIFAPGHSNSQILFNYRFGDMVASHGHNVTIFVAQYDRKAGAEPPKLANVILFPALPDHAHFREIDERFQNQIYGADFSWFDYMFAFADYVENIFVKGCRNQLADEGLLRRLTEEKFDLAIGHMYDYCPMGLIRAARVPTFVWMSAGTLLDTMAWTLGVPNPPSHVPGTYSAFADRMTFAQRFRNFLGVALYHQMHRRWMVRPQVRLFRERFGADFPDVERLASRSPLVFVNTDEMLEFPRPTLHKVVYIGGAHVRTAAPLSADWRRRVDAGAGRRGFVIVSFGAVAKASAMPPSWKDSFLKAFAQFPDYTFIWKFETDLDLGGLTNVILTKWMPLRDLLTHPEFKGIITHCGYNTFLEAANMGAPMIMIPLFNDQSGNRLRAERLGLGVGLDRRDLKDARPLISALGEILNNDTYRTNARNLARKLAKRPVKAEQLVIGWIEYLAEFQNLTNLQPVSADLSLIEYHSLDVLACLISALSLVSYAVYYLLSLTFRKIMASRRVCSDIPVEDKNK